MRKTLYAGAVALLFCLLAPSLPAAHGEESDLRDAGGRLRRHESGEAAREAASRRLSDIERKRARIREAMLEENRIIRGLADEHRRARTDAEKDALRKELKDILEEGFERRHSALKERLEELRNECYEIEKRLKHNIDRKDEIIEMRLDRLLGDAPCPLQAPGRGRGRGIAGEENQNPGP